MNGPKKSIKKKKSTDLNKKINWEKLSKVLGVSVEELKKGIKKKK